MDRWVPELFLISLPAAFCGSLTWIHDHELFAACRGCGGCSFPGTPALTRRQRKIGAKEDDDDHVENSLHFPHRHLDPLTAKSILEHLSGEHTIEVVRVRITEAGRRV